MRHQAPARAGRTSSLHNEESMPDQIHFCILSGQSLPKLMSQALAASQ
ncbi:hypothetical protein [Azotobacter salinestris]